MAFNFTELEEHELEFEDLELADDEPAGSDTSFVNKDNFLPEHPPNWGQ